MDNNYDELYKILKEHCNERTSVSDLYKLTVVAEEYKEDTFDRDKQHFLVIYFGYLCNKYKGIDYSEFPFEIDKRCSFKEFYSKVNKYKNYPRRDTEGKTESYFALFYRTIYFMVMHSGDWMHINADEIRSKKKQEKTHSKKLYVSVDNEHLHLFAFELIKKSIMQNINFSFKINDNEFIRRRDNVVIYTTDEDVKKYILSILDIKKEHPEIDFGSQYRHLFAYGMNEYIGIAPCEERGATQSYTDKICDEIIELRDSAIDFDTFFSDVKACIEEKQKEVKSFGDKVYKDIIRDCKVREQLGSKNELKVSDSTRKESWLTRFMRNVKESAR